jgi:hypothetical protein
MLAPIRKLQVKGRSALLVIGVGWLISCASDKQPVTVVKDAEMQKESTIPWNEQQKWEQSPEMSALNPLTGSSDRAR